VAEKPPAPAESTPPPASAERRSPSEMPRVIVRAYPKVIFFWLTWLASLVMGFIQKGHDPALAADLGTIWVIIFAFNLVVISFDFNEVVSVMVLAVIAVVIFAGLYWKFLGPIGEFIRDLDVGMNSRFYFSVFGVFTIIYFFVFLKTRFNYWEFRYNEVIHREGVFPNIKRYSTEDLRWFKEVPDVLERVLAGSGRMILTTPREPHPIVLENVLRIGSIDEKVADILGTKRVTLT
jgi:hypothetical protein